MKCIILFVLLLNYAAARVYAETATSAIQGTTLDSEIHGTAKFTDTPEGLQAEIEIFAAPLGDHGIHIHEFGNCDDRASAAGGHFNPAGAPHGFLPKDGPKNAHAGDLGNITIGAWNEGALKVTLPGLTAGAGTYSVAGRAIVLHEKADNFGQPVGNAGSRIACGVIRVER